MGFSRARGRRCRDRFAASSRTKIAPSQYNPNGPPSPQFRIVHAVRISKDGLVYVCDRTNDRLQVFTKAGKFLREVVINKDTLGSGSVWDVGFSTDPAQTFLYINDGTNQLIYVLHRETLQVVSTFGGAGHQVGQFYGAHVLAVNSKGICLSARPTRASESRSSPTRPGAPSTHRSKPAARYAEGSAPLRT